MGENAVRERERWTEGVWEALEKRGGGRGENFAINLELAQK